MSTLITESSAYSEKAIEYYEKLGPVWTALPPEIESRHVKTLVIRLASTIDEEYLSAFPNVRAIVTPTTGLTHIDLEFCEKKSIQVFSLQNCKEAIEAISSTSELTLGLIIALIRGIVPAHEDVVQNQHWRRDQFRSRQLSSLTLGIVGVGRIGGHLCKYGKSLGMDIIAFDPDISADRFKNLDLKRAETIEQLFSSSDVVSLHANLTTANHNLVNSAVLKHAKPGSFLVNTARGALVDENAAVTALRSGALAGIAVDVLSAEHEETALDQSQFITAAREGLNVLITPHIGGCTSDAMHLTEEILAQHFVNSVRPAH